MFDDNEDTILRDPVSGKEERLPDLADLEWDQETVQTKLDKGELHMMSSGTANTIL